MTNRLLIFSLLVFASCGEKEKVPQRRYIDMKGFFTNEVSRLDKLNTKVNKTVSRNGVSESKVNISPDWNMELSLFSESDINKPAWSNSYIVRNDGGSTLYTATDNKLRTRSISIARNKNGRITRLSIVNSTTNYLYNSSEELLYIPDSLYRIVKKQDVLLLGKNSYKISGFFK